MANKEVVHHLLHINEILASKLLRVPLYIRFLFLVVVEQTKGVYRYLVYFAFASCFTTASPCIMCFYLGPPSAPFATFHFLEPASHSCLQLSSPFSSASLPSTPPPPLFYQLFSASSTLLSLSSFRLSVFVVYLCLCACNDVRLPHHM
jgi:hypothetical protein